MRNGVLGTVGTLGSRFVELGHDPVLGSRYLVLWQAMAIDVNVRIVTPG